MPNRKRKCRLKSCGAYRPAADMLTVPAGSFCDAAHALQYARENGDKLRQKRVADEAKQARKEARLKRAERTSLDWSYQFELTRKAAQVLANRLDAELPCICCDEPRGRAQFCGGHGKTGAGHPELAVDLCNIHGQRNALCNQHKSGNWSGDKRSKGYRQGLLDRFGPAMVEYLETDRDRTRLSCQEFIEIRAVYKAEIRRLEREEAPTRNWRTPGDFDALRASLPCNTIPSAS